MRRNPELAHKVSQLPEVVQARHRAIDRVTAAHLAVDMLSRATAREVTPINEIDLEERAQELMEDALYEYTKYRRFKMRKYEELFHSESERKEGVIVDQNETITNRDATINRGNKLIKAHSDALNSLKEERGIQ